jgi:hypothetical protein
VIHAQKISSPGFVGFAAQRPCAQRSIAADLIFLVLFVSRQKGLAQRQLSGENNVVIRAHSYAHAVSIIDLVAADLSL